MKPEDFTAAVKSCVAPLGLRVIGRSDLHYQVVRDAGDSPVKLLVDFWPSTRKYLRCNPKKGQKAKVGTPEDIAELAKHIGTDLGRQSEPIAELRECEPQISLLDFFAGMALVGLLHGCTRDHRTESSEAYDIAKAMMAERARRTL